jgi:predicted alpha/beta hydrolase
MSIAAVPSPAPDPAFDAFELPAVDGVPLAARHFRPDVRSDRARGAVLIAPAMGVPQAFYAPLARWLAGLGYHVLTFDFRGMYASRRGSLRALDVDVVGWARLDATAALRTLQDRAPGARVTWIGHSLGGQIVPFVPDHRELAKIVTIATGSGYWRENARPLRRKVWLFWFVAVPLVTPVVGYFPGNALGMVGDLPRGVVEQWRRWCLDPAYAIGVEPGAAVLFGGVTTPITSLSFTDDEMMSARNIEALHAAYTAAPVALRRFTPAELGEARIGHFGFFKQPALWDRVLRSELA